MGSATTSPYEVLGIGPSATAADIMRAYQVALKARRYEPPFVSWAFNVLRNPRTRLACDLEVFDVESVRKALIERLREAASARTADPLDVPMMPVERLVLADRALFLADWREVPDRVVSFEEDPAFGADESMLPLIEFPS